MRHRAHGPMRRFLTALGTRMRRPVQLPLAGHPDRAVIYVLSIALVLLLGTAGVQQLGAEDGVGRLASVNRPLSTERSMPEVSRSADRPETPSAETSGAATQVQDHPRRTAAQDDPRTPAGPSSASTLEPTGSPTQDPPSTTVPTGSSSASDPASDQSGGSSPAESDSQSPSQEPADTDPPQTTIVSGPTNNSQDRFEFDADEAATFSCSLDGGAYESCDSDEEFEDLDPGRHTLAVRATDLDGNTDPSPAQWEWQTSGR